MAHSPPPFSTSSTQPAPSLRQASRRGGTECRLCPGRAKRCAARGTRSEPSPARYPFSSAATPPECASASATPGAGRDPASTPPPRYQTEFARCGKDSTPPAEQSAAPSVERPLVGLERGVLRPWPSASVLSSTCV